MYKFVRCRTHAKCPNLQGWYLVLEPNDLETLEKLHQGISAFYIQKFGLDPYLQKDMSNPDTVAYLKHPVHLAGLWSETIEKQLFRGRVLVNSRGGILPNDVRVLAEVTREGMLWPDEFDPEEVITISRWPKGFHFYLSSSKERIFTPPKYETLEEAREVAEIYTNNIQEKL